MYTDEIMWCAKT